ncbi:unnamed protein product [Brassicogethes aeneus]|uniref:Uncharacterized protein n=1 Tax=Brassicogethes aeneus TaxID=1431903 RepID=A0A9P0FDT1_BRAAE|nr:unnamed protein product [Brassicogethes aeneus]
MSPEINGNPPSVIKRKKNRDKKSSVANNMNSFDLNVPNSTYFPSTMPQYHNNSIPDISAYYSFVNNSNPSGPMSLPVFPVNYPNYFPPNPNINFMGTMSTPKHATLPNNLMVNGDNSEYLSLPVVNLDQTDEPSKRRFSDPGLPNESDTSSNSFDEQLVEKLTYQVGSLQEQNRKLSKEVMEMRIELNILKQQQSLRHYDRDYEPGMLSDIIREVRDAARVREDALIARVKHMIEERQLSMNHMQMVSEKNRNNDRILKLEEQLKNLAVSQRVPEPSAAELASNSARQVLELERETLDLRRELQDTRAKKEEADQKLLQLDKKYNTILHRNGISRNSDLSENGKTSSMTSMDSNTTASSVTTHLPLRVTLSGPVTDL